MALPEGAIAVRTLADCVFLAMLFTALLPADAAAYLDPGAGSLFIQGTLAAIAAGLYAARVYWRRLRSLWRPDTPQESSEEWTEGGGND